MRDYAKEYKELPQEAKNLIEEYAQGFEAAEDCFDSLVTLFPDKEITIKALVESYAEWEHQRMRAIEKLEKLGINEDLTRDLYMGYYDYHKNI